MPKDGEQLALIGFARNDGGTEAAAVEEPLAKIERKLALSSIGRVMALVAMFDQHGTNAGFEELDMFSGLFGKCIRRVEPQEKKRNRANSNEIT